MKPPVESPPGLSWVSNLYRMMPTLARAGPQESAQRMLGHIVAGFGGSRGRLALFGVADPERLVIVAGIKVPRESIGSEVMVGEGALGWVARHGQPLLLKEGISIGPVPEGAQFRDASNASGSTVSWPLLCAEQVIGAVSIDRTDRAPLFTEEDLERGNAVIGLVTVMVQNIRLQVEQTRRADTDTLTTLHAAVSKITGQLDHTQGRLLQAEKMASIGQLAAGVAHEINNPIGFVNANLGSLEQFIQDLFAVLSAYEMIDDLLPEAVRRDIQAVKTRSNLAFLRKDSVALLGECREGIERVTKIVRDLRDFSRADSSDEWRRADLHKGLDSTLNIVNSEIRYKADIVKEYGEIPDVECLPAQINQVFMNILMNAAQAMEGSGTITVRTGAEGDGVWVSISDTGRGIPADEIGHIFEPFYTTKRAGEGTGLGLSLSYGIVERHGGDIDVKSEVGVGTTFRIVLPRWQGLHADVEACASGVAA